MESTPRALNLLTPGLAAVLGVAGGVMFAQNEDNRPMFVLGGVLAWGLPLLLWFVLVSLGPRRPLVSTGVAPLTRALLVVVVPLVLALTFLVHNEAGIYYATLTAGGLIVSLLAVLFGRRAAIVLVFGASLMIPAYVWFAWDTYPGFGACWNCASEDLTIGEMWSFKVFVMASFVSTLLAAMVGPWLFRSLTPRTA